MWNPSSETFERALAGLSCAARAAFVADLWAARGWETERERVGGCARVVCTRGDERTVILLPERASIATRVRRTVRTWLGAGDASRSRHDATASVDIVVVPASDDWTAAPAVPADARVHDARSLSDLARYGLDRDEADALFRRHLGEGIAATLGPMPTSDEREPTDSRAKGTLRSGVGESVGLGPLLAVAGVVVLVGTLAVGGVWSGGPGGTVIGASDGSVDASDASAGTPAGSETRAVGDVDPFGTGPPDGTGVDSTRSAEPLVAPGLTPDGVVDPDALAAAHAEGVDGRSYVWRVNYTEQSAGTISRATTTHRVRSASVHRVDVETAGVLITDPGQLVPRPSYADGDRRYVLSNGRIRQRGAGTRDHYAGHAETAFSRLFRATESEVVASRTVRGTFLYAVSLSGSPVTDRGSYRATALVTPRGVVHVFEAQWVDRDSNATVSVRTTYDFAADPNVTRPRWAWSANGVPADNATTTAPPPAPTGE